eukprot:2546896-Prorocentrum_lima.AAC.1
MDVQDQRPAAQLRGVFRTVVLEARVHQASTGSSQTEPYIHRIWLEAQGPDCDQLVLHSAARKAKWQKAII